MTEINVTGLSELQRFLDQLPAKMEANVMRGALRAGMKPVLAQAKANVPVKTGNLRDTLRISGGIDKKTGKAIATVKVGGKYRGKDGFYALWIEFTGAMPHSITGKLSINGRIVSSVSHPGMKAKPFMRPALDAKANDAIMAAGEYIKKRLAVKNGLDTSDITIGIDDEN
jgi:HK97 gp10 family phage protein